MNRERLILILALLLVALSGLSLLFFSRHERSNREVLASVERLKGTLAQETSVVERQAALIEHLTADLKKQERLTGDQVGALQAALAAEQQQRELAVRKAAEANAAACEAQKAEIAKLKEQVAQRTTRLADTIKVRELQLVDQDGSPRVRLHFVQTPRADERPALEFLDRHGQNMASYNPEGVFLTQDAGGDHERASFWMGGISISRKSHNLRLCTTETSSFINLDDRATLMATETGADLTLNDGNGAQRAAMSLSNRDGASLTLFDPNMKPRVALDARKSAAAVEPADALPGMRFMDADGKLRLSLGSGAGSSAGAADAPDYSLMLFGKDGSTIFKAP